MKMLKKIVIGVLVYFLANAALGWITFWTMGSVPDTLVQSLLGCGTIELCMTAGIEIFKPLIEGIVDKWAKKEGIEYERERVRTPDADSEGDSAHDGVVFSTLDKDHDTGVDGTEHG